MKDRIVRFTKRSINVLCQRMNWLKFSKAKEFFVLQCRPSKHDLINFKSLSVILKVFNYRLETYRELMQDLVKEGYPPFHYEGPVDHNCLTGCFAGHMVDFLSMASWSLERVVYIHCLAALDFEAGVEQPFDCLVIQNRQAVRSVEWTLKDSMVTSLLLCAILTLSPRGDFTPIV